MNKPDSLNESKNEASGGTELTFGEFMEHVWHNARKVFCETMVPLNYYLK